MSEEHAARVEALLDEASLLEDGPAKVALLEEAVRLADAHGDAALAYDVRHDLIHAATFGGRPETALVAFSWCLAHCDRERDGRLDHGMLWKYKWVAGALYKFAHIPLEQVHSVLDDVARRYEQAGMSVRAVHKLRCGLAMHAGDRESARRHHRAWQRAAADSVSDCPACERNRHVDYLFFQGEDAEGVAQAEPILQGRLRCTEVPHVTLASVLSPLVRLGRLEEAMDCHRRGLRLVTRNPTFVGDVAEHITFLALTDNAAPAVRLAERHVGWALAKEGHTGRFEFALAARFALERLRAAGRTSVRLRLPQAFPLYREKGRYDVDELAAWFETDAEALAARFDARNGTTAFARRLAENRALRDRVAPFPLPSRRQREEPS